ncbi:MAG: GntP family permease, partial [Flavobacteriaceae bacterium]
MELFYLLIAVLLIILMTTRWKLHPFLALFIIAILYGLAAGMPLDALVSSVNTGFGDTLGKIGLIILFGVIIGAFLERTGGAFSIAERVLQWIGRKNIPSAMGIIGYIISIPVFADSGFLLLQPLNKGLSRRAKITIAGSSVALGLGLLASHTLVPPTPGPIAAAGILDANLGLVIAIGFPVSLVALLAALLYAKIYASKTFIDPESIGDLGELPERDGERPGALRSSIPILVPIILIILKSIA